MSDKSERNNLGYRIRNDVLVPNKLLTPWDVVESGVYQDANGGWSTYFQFPVNFQDNSPVQMQIIKVTAIWLMENGKPVPFTSSFGFGFEHAPLPDPVQQWWDGLAGN